MFLFQALGLHSHGEDHDHDHDHDHLSGEHGEADTHEIVIWKMCTIVGSEINQADFPSLKFDFEIVNSFKPMLKII